MTQIKVEIPKDFIDFVQEFAIKGDLTLETYKSNCGNYAIEYQHEVKKLRISKESGIIQLNPEIEEMYPDSIIFICFILYLTRYLDQNTEHKYAENLVRCDLIAIEKCIEIGLDVKKIVYDFINCLLKVDTDLNKLRMKLIIEWNKNHLKKEQEGYLKAF